MTAPDVPRPPARFRFGAFELDARTGELRRRGLRVRLRGKPIEILLVLLERPGELVSREDLQARLWGVETFVDFDHGLNSAMNKLREGLSDAAENPRFVETVPRRGYRFIAPVERVPEVGAPLAGPPAPDEHPAPSRDLAPPAPGDAAATPGAATAGAVPPASPTLSSRGRRWMSIAAGLVLAATALGLGIVRWQDAPPVSRVMLIVLPFDDLGDESGQDFFAEGITDEMISQLGALDPRRVGVIARTTSMKYRGSGKGVMDIGRELGVDYVLEGTVRRGSERVRITAQLVDVNSQTQLWAEAYERRLDDVLMLQRDVAARIARSLAGGVLSPVLARAATSAPPFAAYELMLRGRGLRQQATEGSASECITTLEEAIRIEPRFAAAHAVLADCYRLLGAPGWETAPPADLLGRARVAAERALALDPLLAEAHAVRAMVRFNLDWDLEGADRDLARAIALNPSFARAFQYRSAVLMTMGRMNDAVAAAARAQELDPLSVTEQTTLGVRLYYAGRYPEALAQFTRTLAGSPDFAVARWGRGVTARELGRHDEAIAELQTAVALSQHSPYMRAWLAHGLATAGRPEEAIAIRTDLERLARERYVSPFLMALVASGLRDRAATLDWLEKTRAARSGWIPFLRVEPELAWLRRDPRFERVARLR